MPNHVVYEVKIDGLNKMQEYMFVVVFAKFKGKWVFCCHKNRNTYELPGGHIEKDESCLQAAKRELYEETGALKFKISPLFDYSVLSSNGLSSGQVYFADIKTMGALPKASEMAKIELFEDLPESLTYPDIQPLLFKKVKNILNKIN